MNMQAALAVLMFWASLIGVVCAAAAFSTLSDRWMARVGAVIIGAAIVLVSIHIYRGSL